MCGRLQSIHLHVGVMMNMVSVYIWLAASATRQTWLWYHHLPINTNHLKHHQNEQVQAKPILDILWIVSFLLLPSLSSVNTTIGKEINFNFFLGFIPQHAECYWLSSAFYASFPPTRQRVLVSWVDVNGGNNSTKVKSLLLHFILTC